MTNRSKAKGDRGELEVVSIFQEAGFYQAQRPRAGALHDRGDVAGVPDLTVQVKNIDDLGRAIRDGLADLAVQKRNNQTPWGVAAIKRRMKGWVAVVPLAEYAEMYSEYHKCKAIAMNLIAMMEQGAHNAQSHSGGAEVHP